jgi:precorrin-2 dehydrogenase/sirohydrochlorin ferrochelatase
MTGTMEKLYPLMLKMSGKTVAIIGGGNVALRKAQGLSVTGAKIIVVSPTILPELQAIANVVWLNKRFSAADIERAHIIYAATDDPEVNLTVAQAIQDWQWFNDTTEPARSDFYTPAVIRTPELTLSISTEGRNPSVAKRVKHQLMDFFGVRDETVPK